MLATGCTKYKVVYQSLLDMYNQPSRPWTVIEPKFKSALRGGIPNFLIFSSSGHPQQRGLQGQELSGERYFDIGPLPQARARRGGGTNFKPQVELISYSPTPEGLI